jgi:hypothetical protein
MKHKVLKSFTDKESGVYHAFGSSFSSTSFDRVTELEELGFVKANEKASTLKKKVSKKAVEADVGKD